MYAKIAIKFWSVLLSFFPHFLVDIEKWRKCKNSICLSSFSLRSKRAIILGIGDPLKRRPFVLVSVCFQKIIDNDCQLKKKKKKVYLQTWPFGFSSRGWPFKCSKSISTLVDILTFEFAVRPVHFLITLATDTNAILKAPISLFFRFFIVSESFSALTATHGAAVSDSIVPIACINLVFRFARVCYESSPAGTTIDLVEPVSLCIWTNMLSQSQSTH